MQYRYQYVEETAAGPRAAVEQLNKLGAEGWRVIEFEYLSRQQKFWALLEREQDGE